MSRTGEIVQYGVMGVGMTVFLYVIFGFAPSLMVSLSIGDFFGGEGFSQWSFIISFGLISGAQSALQANIRLTWAIVIVWWLLSIWPFFHWFCWFYTSFGDTPFPGINWMPW